MDAATLVDLFIKEDLVTPRTRIEAFLLVALGVKPCSLITVPGELPDGAELGQEIDDRYRQTMSKIQDGPIWHRLYARLQMLGNTPLAYKQRLIREAFTDVVESSTSYKAHMRWAKDLGLFVVDWEVRPSIHELYFYKSATVGDEIHELMAERQRLKKEAWSKATKDTPVAFLVYPEEQSPAYLERLGKLLGYPSCCVQAYLRDRDQGENVEARAARDLHLSRVTDGEVEAYPYFVKDLFPCSPRCPEATSIGRQAYEALHALSPELGAVYLDLLKANQEMVLSYPIIISEHLAEMEKKAEEITK